MHPATFAPLEPAPRPDNDLSPAHELDNNPRYLVLRQFQSRFLPDARDIEVYLPEAYINEPARQFPVFYLHDGQNLFDGRTSYIPDHTWQAHTTADRLTRAGLIEPVILVGINNTGLRRMAEYTPTRDPAPRRRRRRPLRPAPRRRAEALHRSRVPHPPRRRQHRARRLLARRPHLALPRLHLPRRLLASSPSSLPASGGTTAPSSALVAAGHTRPSLRIWLDMGTAEGLRHLRDTDLLHRRLIQNGWRDGLDIDYLRVPGGQHNEDAWAARFDQVLRFLFPPPQSA